MVLGVFLLAGLGLQCPDLLAGVFSGEFAGLDGLDDLPVSISELVVATFAVILGLAFAVVPGVFLLATLSLQSLQFFDGVFPGELTGLDGLADFSPGISELVAAALAVIFGLGFAVVPGVFLLATLGLQSLQFFAGVFPGELAGLDGLDDLFAGFSKLVAAAFIFTFGFTFILGLSLVITLAPGRFPGVPGPQAFSVSLDAFFESCVGILLGDFAFLDKPVVFLLLFSKPYPALDGFPSFAGLFPGDLAAPDGFTELSSGGLVSGTAVAFFTLGLAPVPGTLFAILGGQCHRNGEHYGSYYS